MCICVYDTMTLKIQSLMKKLPVMWTKTGSYILPKFWSEKASQYLLQNLFYAESWKGQERREKQKWKWKCKVGIETNHIHTVVHIHDVSEF